MAERRAGRLVKPTTRKAAEVLGDKTYVASACVCGCTEFYTVNGACVDCTKRRAHKRYETPEGRRAQRDGDARRYIKRKQRNGHE